MCKTFTNTPSTLTFCLLQKMTCLDRKIQSWHGFNSLRCPLMLRTNYWCVQSINIIVGIAKCVEKFHKFNQYTHFLSVAKMTWLDWTKYSWQGFNSLGCPLMLRTNYWCVQSLNISVGVAKCVEIFHKFIHTLTFCPLQKMTCFDWTINSCQCLYSLVCPLMKRSN